MIPTETEIAYAAGLFDGEGCVSIYFKDSNEGSYHNLSARLSNTHRGALEWVRERFGGKIYMAVPGGNGGWQTGYVLTWTAKNIPRVLGAIAPYVIIKKEAVRIALEFCEIKKIRVGRRGLSAEAIEQRENLRQELIAINGYRLKNRRNS